MQLGLYISSRFGGANRLVIVRICRYCFVIQEIGFVLGCTHTLEGPGWLVQMEEVC